jgi:hypothetical protein
MKPNLLLTRWTLLVAVLALILSLASSSPSAGKSNKMVLDVLADPGQLDLIESGAFPGQGPFYIPGTIFRPGTSQVIGEFHCWGFFIQGGALAVVAQEFHLFGRGKIQVQGVEDEGPRAVTGGTGDFLNVRGEMTGADLSNFPDFRVTFRLLGARR